MSKQVRDRLVWKSNQIIIRKAPIVKKGVKDDAEDSKR